MVREKRKLFEIYITNRNERNREEYMQKNQEVNTITRQKKSAVGDRDGIQLIKKFRENKKKYIYILE